LTPGRGRDVNVNINMRMMPRLVERMAACSAVRGLSQHDFIIFAIEREVSRMEALRKREAGQAGSDRKD